MAAVLGLLLMAYVNHFDNSFHFDDSHTVSDNPWIRDLRNIPRFFRDGSTFSVLPSNRSYRPLVTASLAIDYWLGGGLNPFWFHVSTFVWFLALCGSIFVLYRETARRAGAGISAWWAATAGAALYALHPVEAETVNYVIQRGDLYATLGVVAGLALYARYPGQRRWGLYLIPVVLGVLSKPPAAVFPALLLIWLCFFEGATLISAAIRSAPAFLVTGLTALFTMRMDPPTFVAGAVSPVAYRYTQPAVLLGYFRKFFLPVDLTADTDHYTFSSPWQPEAVAGSAFLALLVAMTWWCSHRLELRPIAFGFAWFLIASTPTSLVALAEVENDHRMFLPFAGLTLSFVWAAKIVAERWRVPIPALVAGSALVLGLAAWGTMQRNRVWDTEESLWFDVTHKSPKNGRGLMNYALTQMAKADYARALTYLNQAALLNPAYYVLEVNLGVANGAAGNAKEAEAHFARAIDLAENDVSPRYYYARWLRDQGRQAEALGQLAIAQYENPDFVGAALLAMEIYSQRGDARNLRAIAERTLTRFPTEPEARARLAEASTLKGPHDLPKETPEHLLDASLAFYNAHEFEQCIAIARQALALRPNYPEAWNNIAAGFIGLQRWDEGIAAARQALSLKPDFELAQRNLAWAEKQKS